MARNLARFSDSSHRSDGSGASTAQATSADGASSSHDERAEHSRRCAASARSHEGRVLTLCPRHCHSQRSCRAPTILWKWPHHARPFAVDTRTVTSTPVDDSASRLSAHVTPLVSPRSSSMHGKLCNDPSPEDWIFVQNVPRTRTRLASKLVFFFGGALLGHPKLSQRLRCCFGSRSSGIEIALVRGRRDIDGGGQSLPALGGLFALGSCDVVCRTAIQKKVSRSSCAWMEVPLCPSFDVVVAVCLDRPDHRAGSGRWRRVCHQNTHSGDVGNGELRSCPAHPPGNAGDSLEPMPRSQLDACRGPDAVDAMAVGAR